MKVKEHMDRQTSNRKIKNKYRELRTKNNPESEKNSQVQQRSSKIKR
jgi:hypothetical protein